MVAAKKTKKSLESISSRLQLVRKSGKYVLGYKQTLKMIRQGKAKLAILANNCPALRKSEREYSPCWPTTLVSITTLAIILNWAQHVENPAEYARWLSLSQVILILLEACQNRLVTSKSCTIFP
uniref:Ribosomal protein eL8/eL30/eS12/Gadd45 domain-containing protein n=1 Tax=Bos indicus x Bos taurus TaxID=30522 RepID=A0A4W2DBG5_BOBOX